MWKRLKVPPICERMIGFSIPQDDEILIVSYEGVHLLHLGDEVTVQTDNNFAGYDIYDVDSGIALYQDTKYQIIGLEGGNPILKSSFGERLTLDTDSEILSVMRGDTTVFSTEYENFSGDWATATFCPDGRYIVLGCPYDFDFVVLVRAA